MSSKGSGVKVGLSDWLNMGRLGLESSTGPDVGPQWGLKGEILPDFPQYYTDTLDRQSQ